VKNISTIMGVTGPLHVEGCSALQMEVFHWIYMLYNVNTIYKNSACMKVNKVLSCVPVMCACEETHDLIWILISYTAGQHICTCFQTQRI
jgi:hypothetical protein